ncbi:MAG: DUF4298 domain-containing protein [Bacteroidales bacterium]|nr:DUF4298 domain-containing protein [Bacteroidales bacterium]
MRKKLPEAVLRVKDMEQRFDIVYSGIALLGTAVNGYEEYREDIEVLKAYMESGQWKKDFEADEAGAFPESLKRGVLSEDGLYSLLEEADGVVAKARLLFGD